MSQDVCPFQVMANNMCFLILVFQLIARVFPVFLLFVYTLIAMIRCQELQINASKETP